MNAKFWFLTLSIILLLGSIIHAQEDSLSAYGVKWSPDGRWIAANTSSGVWVFDTENPDTEPQIYYEGQEVHLIAFNPNNNELAVVILDWEIEYVYKNGMINLETGEASEAEIMLIGGNRSQLGPISAMSSVYELSYTSDGAYVILAMDNLIYFYEPTFHRVDFFQRATEPENYIVSVAQISDTNNFLALSWSDGANLTMVNREGGLLSSHEPEHSSDVVHYLDDTRAILPARDGIYIFDFGSDEEEILIAAAENDSISASAYFAPTSTVLLGASGLWQAVDVRTGELKISVETESEQMRFVAFDFKPDGSQFASLLTDGSIILWDGETGEALVHWDEFDNAYGIKWG